MDLDKKLLELCEVLGKETAYKGILKRTYNEIVKQKAEEGLTADILNEDDFQKLILYEVCNKYEIRNAADIINNDDIGEAIIGDEDFIDIKDIEMDVDDKKAMDEILEMAQDPMETEDDDSWKSIFKTTPAPKKFSSEGSQYKDYAPSFTIIDRVTYRLKVTDPSKSPAPYNGTDKWGKQFEKFIIGVTLLGISDETLYKEVFEKGERRGEPLYKKNKEYALFLNKEKGFPEFVQAFKEVGLNKPSSQPFYLKRFKQTSKKGNKYNVFKFAVKQ